MSSRRKMVNRRRAALIAHLTAEKAPAVSPARQLPEGVVIRTAGRADMGRVRDLCALAEVDLEDGLVAAVEGGYAGAALHAGQVGGTGAFFSDVKRTLPNLSAESLHDLFLRLSLVLVADDERAGVVGAAMAFPPAGTIMNQLQAMQSTGSSTKDQMEVMLGGALRVSRIKAVGVDEEHRRHGLGATLVEAAITPFAELGYSMIYGIMPPKPGLREFYAGLGFTVLPPGTPLSLEAVGVPAGIQPGPDERIFYRDR